MNIGRRYVVQLLKNSAQHERDKPNWIWPVFAQRSHKIENIWQILSACPETVRGAMIDWISYSLIWEEYYTGRIFGSDWFLVICLFRGGRLLTESPLSAPSLLVPSSLLAPFPLSAPSSPAAAPPSGLSGEWGPPSPIMPTQPSLTTEKDRTVRKQRVVRQQQYLVRKGAFGCFSSFKTFTWFSEIFGNKKYHQQLSVWEGPHWNRTLSWFINALSNWTGKGDEKYEKNLFRNIFPVFLWNCPAPLTSVFELRLCLKPPLSQVWLVLCESLHAGFPSQPNFRQKRSHDVLDVLSVCSPGNN